MEKQATVQEMGKWIGSIWTWHLSFRRPLYQWEEEKKGELEESLKHIQLKDRENDRIVWAYSTDGMFNTNSLMQAAMTIKRNKKNWEQIPFHLWSGVAPPKVETLIWRIYMESLPSKEALGRRRVLRREEDLSCVLCEKEQETADHLLIHCSWSWLLWSMCLQWWGAAWVMPEKVKALLESWIIEGRKKSYKRLWKTLCYAVLWSIWDERNKRCFQKKKRSTMEIFELTKARLAWWAKYRSSNCPYSTMTIKRCIEEVRDNN
ncbi:hypothetical protein QQ045_028499 [Rhodiola kirilowii]